jgi:hypothetical protein
MLFGALIYGRANESKKGIKKAGQQPGKIVGNGTKLKKLFKSNQAFYFI